MFKLRDKIKTTTIAFMLVFASGGALIHCGGVQPTLKTDEAYTRVYVAIAYKTSECGGTQPNYPILFLDEPSQFGVDACAFAIIRGECPFTDYPLICLEAYNVDVPNEGPDLNISLPAL